MTTRRAVLLLASPASYRLTAFQTAAKALGIESITGLVNPIAPMHDTELIVSVSSANIASACAKVNELRARWDSFQVLAVDDTAVEMAAALASSLGITTNRAEAAEASRNKIRMRQLFAAAGLPSPAMRPFNPDRSSHSPLPYPVVVKPAGLNGSRGVIRANDDDEFAVASHRLTRILQNQGIEPSDSSALVESFIPGEEVAIEGIMTDGALTVLAIFDKPDPLDGPFFEETIYVTPSRHSEATQTEIASTVERMANALGLAHGPVHAEVRLNDTGVWPLEVASRSIGGMCSSVLEFGAGMSLEELILRHAFGETISGTSMTDAAGVLMIPIPGSGLFRGVSGIDQALAVSGITGVDITAVRNHPIQRLPEGDSYLGFVFARGGTPDQVEDALRRAHELLDIEITPTVHLTVQ